MTATVQSFYVYIVTNPNKTTLYIGVTNNLSARLVEHWNNRNSKETFAGKYFCYYLIYYEEFSHILPAIAREKEIKKWNRAKKEVLINSKNPGWNFLNKHFCAEWPPLNTSTRY